MHTSHLGKHIVADNRLVRRNGYTAIALHHSRDIVQLILTDVGASIELVLQNHLNTGERCIATSLAQPVHRYV